MPRRSTGQRDLGRIRLRAHLRAIGERETTRFADVAITRPRAQR
jgi:hypothetical protein